MLEAAVAAYIREQLMVALVVLAEVAEEHLL
jgi:hypothetical protein